MSYKGCTPAIYTRRAAKVAQETGVCLRQILSGSRKNAHTKARWALWRQLKSEGFSYFSIGNAAGFDHTSIRYACLRDTDPLLGRNRGDVKTNYIAARSRSVPHHALPPMPVSGSAISFSPIQSGSIPS